MSKTEKKSTTTRAVKETPKAKSEQSAEPIITVDQLITQAVGQCYTAESLNRSAEQIEQLSEMLFHAQDRGVSLNNDDPQVRYLAEMASGVQILMSATADEIERAAGYVTKFSEAALRLRDQREAKGGAE
jgi:NH3-dependent NAD+ synthetase